MKKYLLLQFAIVLGGTLFAWFNFTKEMLAYLGQAEAVGCSTGITGPVNPIYTPCFYGAIFFSLALAVASHTLWLTRKQLTNFKGEFSTKEAKRIGDQMGLDWNKYDLEEFRMGLKVELEHGLENNFTNVTNNDPILTGKIAVAHLNEIPDYYTRLNHMEAVAEGKIKAKK